MALHTLSICSGIGGLDLGVSRVLDTRVVCYVEREISVAGILVERMAEGALDEAPIYSDLAACDGRPWRGSVDLITAGLPYQPFSVAGKQRGEADERYIWPEFFRIISEVRPAMVFLENVPGILKWFETIGEQLSALGYEFEAGLFSAAEVGAPHKRERFFCLAVADTLRSGRQQITRGSFSNEEEDGGAGRVVLQPDRNNEPASESTNFPPGPNEHQAWSDLLVREPWMRPALSQAEAKSMVCRIADGFPLRLDRTARLQALGNAVVPACAELALRSLIERFTQ